MLQFQLTLKLQKIKYKAPPTIKTLKQGHGSFDVPVFPYYSFYFQNYWEALYGGLISGSKGRIKSQNDYFNCIIETNMKENAQTVFNFVDKVPDSLAKDEVLKVSLLCWKER